MLAKRFLLSKVSDRFLSFIAWVSVIGVALGVLALTVVTSVINGYEDELANVITGMNGDLILYSRGEPVRDSEKLESRIRQVVPGLKALTPGFITELLVTGPHGTGGAVLEGIHLPTIGDVTEIPKRVVRGRLPVASNEVAIGFSLAEKIGAEVGTRVKLIAPFVSEEGVEVDQQDEETASLQAPKLSDAEVVGIVRMGMHDYDSKFVFGTIDYVREFLNYPDHITAFKIKLEDRQQSERAVDRLTETFGYPFRAKDWIMLNRNMFIAIKLEKAVIAIILTVIVIVAAFNVVSTLMMMIHDKTREIAILKAMGFSPAHSFLLFSLVGLGIGAVGIATGIGGGLIVNWILEQTHWIDLPPDIYNIGYLPVVVKWMEIGLIALVAIVIAFLATIYPAYRVMRLPPLQGLRNE